jgi:hypothetical protein
MIRYLIDNMQNYYIEYFTLDKEWSYNNAKPYSPPPPVFIYISQNKRQSVELERQHTFTEITTI